MAEYPRTEAGFARALKDADWFINFHEAFREGRKTLWMYVPAINPTVYATSVIEPGPSEIEAGTGKINCCH